MFFLVKLLLFQNLPLHYQRSLLQQTRSLQYLQAHYGLLEYIQFPHYTNILIKNYAEPITDDKKVIEVQTVNH